MVCLPYKFEGVFPYIKNYYLKNLRVGLSSEVALHREEIGGAQVNWGNTVKNFVYSEYIEKVEKYLSKPDGLVLESDWQLSLELSLIMAVNLFLNNQEKKSTKYFKNFNELLYKTAIERVNAYVMRSPSVIEVYFGTDTNRIGMEQFKKVIETLYEFCEVRTKFVDHIGVEFRKAIQKLEKLVKIYLSAPFKEGRIEFEDYVTNRSSKIPNVQQFRNDYRDFQEAHSQELHEELKSTVIEAEKSILKEFIKEE